MHASLAQLTHTTTHTIASSRESTHMAILCWYLVTKIMAGLGVRLMCSLVV